MFPDADFTALTPECGSFGQLFIRGSPGVWLSRTHAPAIERGEGGSSRERGEVGEKMARDQGRERAEIEGQQISAGHIVLSM